MYWHTDRQTEPRWTSITRRVLWLMALAVALWIVSPPGRAMAQGPVAQSANPVSNTHTAPLTTTVSITYDQSMDATTVTSRTFAVYGMQTGLVTGTHGVINGHTLVVTPTGAFHPGEWVQATATTSTLNITGTAPLSPTVWQFRTAVNDGAGDFAVSRNFGTGSDATTSVALGDVDGDGDLDMAVGNWGGQNVVYLNGRYHLYQPLIMRVG